MKASLTLLLGSSVLALLVLSIQTQAQQPAQDPVLRKGQEQYAQSCTGFCHGPGGEVGQQAPRLVNRGLDGQYIERVITYGVPGTAMPPWGQRLIKEDLTPVIAYVKSLNGIVSPSANPPALPFEATRGRDLFFDPTQELGACSNCHSFEGKGISVASISHVPVDVRGLRSLAGNNPSQMKTATAGRETFPALVATELKDETHLYDMTAVPPSLRTFPKSAVALKDGSTWRHNVGKYTEQELSFILAYLREMVRP